MVGGTFAGLDLARLFLDLAPRFLALGSTLVVAGIAAWLVARIRNRDPRGLMALCVLEAVFRSGSYRLRNVAVGYAVVLAAFYGPKAVLKSDPTLPRRSFARAADRINGAEERFVRTGVPQRVTLPILPEPWGEINLNIPNLARLYGLPQSLPFPPSWNSRDEGEAILEHPELGALTVLDDGWRQSQWLGFLHTGHWPWVYHRGLGWFRIKEGCRPDDFWLYDPNLDWIWTSASQYPFLYNLQPQTWLKYLPDTRHPRWFYIFNPRDVLAEGWGIR